MSGDGVGYEPLKDEDAKSPEPEVAPKEPLVGRPTLAFQKGRDDAAAAKGEQLVLKAAEGDLEAVSQLLLRDADINYATKKGKYTALIKACRMKRVDVAKFLIDQGAAVNFASQNGWTALIEASRVGCAELVELLLQKEADVEATNRMGWTALVEACRNAHFNVVKLLVEKGHALVGHIDKDGLIALEHTSAPLKNIRDFLSANLAEERRQGRSAPPPDVPLTAGEIFAEAAGAGDFEKVKKMLESGEVDVNSVNRNGKYTALTLACRNQRVEIAKYLVEKGADMNKKSTTGWTCLIEAARVGNPELITFLTDKSRPGHARINDTNDFGWPPLIEACRNSYFKCVKLLLELGADPGIEDGDGEPPLEHTSQPWIVALLEDKLHAGSPRSRLLAFLEESKSWSPQLQMAKFLELVDDAMAQTSAEKQIDVAFIIAQTLVQERNVPFLTSVLQRDVFQSALCTHKQNIIHSIVQLPPPEDDRGGRTSLPAFAKQANELCAVMKVILDSLFGDNFEAAQLFLSPPKGISASLQCAMNYSAILEKKASDLEKEPREGLPALAHYYALMLNNLMLLGSRLGDVDGNKATAIHHMLRMIPVLSKLGDLCPVQELILHWRTFWRSITEPIPELPDRYPSTYGLNANLLNKRDGAGRPAIVYLIMLSEVPEREDVLLGFMEYGAQFPEIIPDAPDFKMERNRLITILGDIMQDNPESSWRIMRNAVRNNDTALVDAVIQRKLPVYMVNPRLFLQSQRNRRRASQFAEEGEQSDHETDDKPPLLKAKSDGTALSLPFDDTFGYVQDGQTDPRKKKRWAAPSADLGRLEECLLHMLVELENKALFNKMLDYSERPSSKAPKNEKYPTLRWPWPNDGINGAIQWRNSFGMNIFHIIARKKLAMPSKKNTELFQQLLAKDLHAMVARADNYGWSAIHYAAYTNKLDVITELIRSNIDIGQITSGLHQFDYEQTSLHIASEQGNWAVSLALCKAGAMVDDIDKNGCTPLALAMLARQKYLEKKEKYEEKVALGQSDQVDAGDHPDIVVINARCVADIAYTDPALLAFVQEATNKDKQRRASKAAGLGTASGTAGEARIDIASDADIPPLPPLPPLPTPPPAAKQPAIKRVGTTRHTGNTLPRVRKADAAAGLALSAGPVMEMKNSSSSEDEAPLAPKVIPKQPPVPPGSLNLLDYFNQNIPDFVLRYIDDLPLEFSEWADKYYEVAKREFDAQNNGADAEPTKKSGQTRAHERGPSRMPTTEIIDRTVLYNMTIEALLNHEASIATASSSSGKTLYELMNVDEKWDLLSTEIETLRHQKSLLEDEYYDSLYQDVEVTEMVGGVKKTSKRPLTLEERRNKKDDIDLQLLVLETRAGEVFLNKESQMVINQYYDERIRMRSFLKLIRYGIFLTLITVLGIMQTTRDTQSAFYLNAGLQAGLVDDDFDYALSPIPKQFSSITNNPDEIYMWLESIVIPAFYSGVPQYWDGPNQINMRSGLLFEGHNIVIGVPRLRTVRAMQLPNCDQPSSFSGLSKVCFSRTEEETRPWSVPTSNFDTLDWRTESDTGATSVWGRVYVIPGSGYTVDLPPLDPANSDNATALIQELKAARFVDAGTRALMLEFTVFNPHENHFAVGTMYLEFPLGGGIINSFDFFVTKLRRTVASYDRVLNALAIIVLLLVLLHTFSESQQILSSRNCAYFASAYNWADMAIIVFSPCIFGLWIAEYVIETETDWRAVDVFVPVARMARLNYVQNIFWSILILISWGKLFDYLSVFHKLYRMIIIIETSAGRLSHIFIVFAIVLAGFTSAEYVAYGYLDSTSYTWLWGFLNRYIAIFSGGPVLFAHTDVARILGTIYVCLYVLIFTVLLLNLIIAILTSGYDDAIHASSDTMARRQYFKMQSEGLTKNVAEEEEEEGEDVNSRMDSVLLDYIDEVYTKVDDWLDRKVFGRLYTTEIEDFVPTETIKLIQAKAKELQKQAQAAGSAVGGVGSAVAHGVVVVGTTVARAANAAGTTVVRGVGTAGTAVVNVAASAGNAVVNVGQTVVNAFHIASPRAARPSVTRDANEAKQQ